jgi:hypothetical protein
MNAIIPTRRTMLGSLGAAALAGIAFPWRAKANDIVIASELPPDPQPVEVARVDAPAADLSPGVTLYDKAGREVAIVTSANIEHELLGLIRGTLTAEMLPPFMMRFGMRTMLVRDRCNCSIIATR